MHRMAVVAGAVLASSFAAGCAAAGQAAMIAATVVQGFSAANEAAFMVASIARGLSAPDEQEPSREAEVHGDQAYLIVSRPDVRECAFPNCGGIFVKAVNGARTTCADGVARMECHVASLDLDDLALPHAQQVDLAGDLGQRHAFVLGSLVPVDQGLRDQVSTLVVREAFRGAGGKDPIGRFSLLTDEGVRCNSSPCLNLREEELNSTRTRRVANVDLTACGATEEEIDRGRRELIGGGLLAIGRSTTIKGPAGSATGFVATDFYLRVERR